MPTSEPERPEEQSANVHVDCSRRRLLSRLSLALAAASAALLGIPVVGFVLGPFTKRVREVWRDIGHIESFQVGKRSRSNTKTPHRFPGPA